MVRGILLYGGLLLVGGGLIVTGVNRGWFNFDEPSPGRPATEVRVSDPETIESVETPTFPETDWPWWRGPNRDGHAAGPLPPTEFGPDRNVVWVTDVPGRGHGSPTIVGDRIYLQSAEEAEASPRQMVLCFNRETGEERWRKVIHRGGFSKTGHKQSTQASPTIAHDGERLFAVFLNAQGGGAQIWVTALDSVGEILWQTPTGGFKTRFGYGSSPLIYKSLVIIAAESSTGGYLCALDRETGKIVWRTIREDEDSFGTPVTAEVGGEERLLIAGQKSLSSYDPLTGKEQWSVPGTAVAAIGSPVWRGDLVFASGGYPQKNTLAVNARTGEKVWDNNVKTYIPSMIVVEDCLITVTDDGIVYCWDAETGKRHWRQRMEGNYAASPVYCQGHFFTGTKQGEIKVFRADADGFELVSEVEMGSEAYPSPVIVDGRLYLRVAEGYGDDRQEKLYCIGK